MATATKPPFHQFTFTQDTGAFHALFDLSAAQDGAYALHVKRTPTPAPGETEAAPAAASAEIAPAAASAPEAVLRVCRPLNSRARCRRKQPAR